MEQVCRFCGYRFTSAKQYYTDHLGYYCRDGKACIEREEPIRYVDADVAAPYDHHGPHCGCELCIQDYCME